MSDQKTLQAPASKKTKINELQHKKGGDALAVLHPTKGEKAPDHENGTTAELKIAPVCMTQDPMPAQFEGSDPLQIFVGLFTSITRWKKGSTINFTAYSGGYPHPTDAAYAANQLNKAAEEWNRHDVGVRFKWVSKLEDAAFVLAYGGDKGGVLASAYFPNESDLNNVFVYKRGFDADTKANMWKFFTHELGHVLGLRHEFALDLQEGTNTVKEGGAVLVGSRNEASVMNYRREPPEIQASDVADTKVFYDSRDTVLGGLPVQTFIPNN